MSTEDIAEESQYDCNISDSGDFDSLDYSDAVAEDDESNRVHPVLLNDIRLLKEFCPNGSVTCRSLNEISEMDITFMFPTTVLEKTVAEAWGLKYGDPVVFQLSVDERYYIDMEDVYKVDVSQKGVSRKSGVLVQLKTIVQEFCRRQFAALNNEEVKKMVDGNSLCLHNDPTTEISELREMGFLREDIIRAYTLSDGTKEGALNFLLEQQDGIPAILPESEAGEVGEETEEAQSSPSCLPHEAKNIPTLSNGFLVQLYLYIEQRLLTLNNFCPVCDNPHSTSTCVMLKPVVCANPLCIFSYQTLGVMANVADGIVTEPQVVNLLIYLTKAASMSERRGVIFSPYPTVVHPSKANEMALHPDNKDFKLLATILCSIPHVQELIKLDDTQLKQLLHEKHELSYLLLRWIISSNRSHIVRLPPNMQLPFMGTKHQFLMRNSPPTEDRNFRMLRKKHGSVFAFHGSPIENWHSIIREGLIVASGTNKQIHGAVHGEGIYLSPKLGVSLNYCSDIARRQYSIDNKSGYHDVSGDYIQGPPDCLSCITLCEVINSGLNKFSDIWTCKKSEYVCTRFFFVYDINNSRSKAVYTVNTTQPRIRETIEKAIVAQMEE